MKCNTSCHLPQLEDLTMNNLLLFKEFSALNSEQIPLHIAVFFVLAVPISGGPDVRLEISPHINMWQDDLGSWHVLLLNSMLWSFLF